jgi:CPA2 family monovalent cation:H+ antiporter-2
VPVEPLEIVNVDEAELRGHIVIAGGGRVGQDVVTLLRRLGRAVVVIELDHHRVDELRRAGVPLVYGDAAHANVLQAAGVERARLVLVTVPNLPSALGTIEAVRRLAPDVHVVARAEAKEALRELQARGVYEVVQPHVEASLEMARQALLHLGVPPDVVQEATDRARRELYAPPKLAAP